ncbi:hypothetical protein [[Kitasatospora] papulosa]|uniref:Uncharacterized protein n=1 Tax=[Kitasatospora] papulosa TaxID=1464011 RepID=A0ABZ1KF68_9ACTN
MTALRELIQLLPQDDWAVRVVGDTNCGRSGRRFSRSTGGGD